MKENDKNYPKLERLGDLCPPISNCRGGIDGDYLLGSLTNKEIQEVRLIRVAIDICNQNAMSKKTECPNHGEVEIAYYPGYTSRTIPPELEINALCLNTDCEHNLSSPAK